MKIQNEGGTYLNHPQLNTVAATYQSDPNGCLRQVYEMLDAFKRRYLQKANGRYMNDEHSFTEAFDTTLWRSLKAYDPVQDFLPFFSSNLKRANVSRIRKGGATKVTAEIYDCVSEDGSSMMESLEDPDQFEESVQKKRDQRELVSNLLAVADELTRKICLNYAMYDSENALSKALGIHHTAVRRSLARLSRRFDANRFGELRDYIA
jgi:DNA-directed RNA polymerase specialized sigma24 family protein